jgi:hypothetical protein
LIDFELPLLKEKFISSNNNVLRLAKYFVKEIRMDKRQNSSNDYSFLPTKEFLELIVDDDNRATYEEITDKYFLDDVRLHCRPALSITETHFDGGHWPTLGVCLAGSKIWSIKKANYWDLLTLHYGAMPQWHHTLDSLLFGRSIWFHDKPDSVIAQKEGALIFLPPGWYHTVVYADDVISFSITLTPKNEALKFRGKPASFFYSPPGPYQYSGSKSKQFMLLVIHHSLHFITHFIRLFMFPVWTLLACIVSVSRFKDWVLAQLNNIKGFLANITKKVFVKRKSISKITISKTKTKIPKSLRGRDQIVLNSLLKFIKENENANEINVK